MSTCELHKDHPENAEVPPEMLLEHFLQCFTPERQLEILTTLKDGAKQGSTCWMANHQGLIQSQARYTAKLLTGIRELLEELAPEASGTDPASGALTDVHTKLKALIS